ncbi:MAG: BUG/TctC family periplasmic protein, partial [uncultured Acetobacteraceae bacterium]
ASPSPPFIDSRRAGGACRVAGARRLARPPRAADRAVPARGLDGHHRPYLATQVERNAGQAGGDREPGRRFRLCGGDRSGQGRGGRLHVAARLRQRSDQPNGDAPAVQAGGGLRTRQLGGDRPARPRHPPNHAVAQLPGCGRRGESGPGHDQLRLVRGGGAGPRVHDAAAAAGRLQADARTLSRRRSSLAGRVVRAGAPVHVQRRHHQPAHPRRHPPSARRHHRGRNAACAGRPELRAAGFRRLRGADVVGVPGTRRDAPGDPQAHGGRSAQHFGEHRSPRADRGTGRGRGGRRTGAMPFLSRQRGREVGQGDPREQHNTGQL